MARRRRGVCSRRGARLRPRLTSKATLRPKRQQIMFRLFTPHASVLRRFNAKSDSDPAPCSGFADRCVAHKAASNDHAPGFLGAVHNLE
jgi:hypothetical protein